MKAVKKILRRIFYIFAGMVAGIFLFIEFSNKYLNEDDKKYKQMYTMMAKWFLLNQKGKNIHEFLHVLNYRNIAIYGMHYIGNILFNELKNSNINVAYAIDKNASTINSDGIEIISPNDKLMMVDAIIVTVISDFEEIKKNLESKIQCPVVSLQKIIEDWEMSD